MSKKTEQIYKALSGLDDLQNQISIITQLEKGRGNESEEVRHLENIEFEMGQQLKSLRFWIDSLYSYNGKSTSNAKKAASQENGKKGGRPPKEITNMKRRQADLEQILEELHKEKIVTTDFETESRLDSQILEYENELHTIQEKLSDWEAKKAVS